MNEHEITRIAAAVNQLRPDWPVASLRTMLTGPTLVNRPRRDVAVALVWVACETDTKTPARVLEAGPWWRATNPDGADTTPRPPRRDEECPAHPGSWQGACNACRADQLAGDQTPRRTETSPIASEHVRSLRGIHAATKAELCACGVPVQNCNDHRATRPDDEDGAA